MPLAGLQDKVAIVTGAAGGIGSAVAKRLVEEGAKVLLVDLDAEAAQRTADSLPGDAIGVGADVSKAEDVEAYTARAVEEFGSLDAVHLNAGYAGKIAPFVDSEVDDFDKLMAINVRGVYLGLRAAIRRMIDAGTAGSIVATASGLGLGGAQNLGPYSASKHAVMGLVRSAALDHARQGIRVNALCPGFVDTNMMRPTETTFGAGDGTVGRTALESIVPLGRYAQPAEMAAMVAWLLSDESSYATGGTFAVDAGTSASVGGFFPPSE